jgi:beta-galactosidase/beta-glucuronidase
MKRIALLSLMALLPPLDAQTYTRGIGVYPGAPAEDFSPAMRIDSETYRNLALRRPAVHSSSYDYNLTAQLAVDGVKETALPRWIAVSTSAQGALPRNQREYFLDDFWISGVDLKGPRGWVEVELGGGDAPPEVSRIEVDARLRANNEGPEGWAATLSGSDDGKTWKDLGAANGSTRLGGEFLASIPLPAPARFRFYRVSFEDQRARTWSIGEVRFFNAAGLLHLGGPYHFTSAWMSAGRGEEWIYVDLGAVCTFDRVALAWIRRPAEGALQISDDAAAWKTLQPLGAADDIQLPAPASARYVRVLMTKPASPEGYILSELEVWGRGGPRPEPHPAPALRPNGRLDLAGGAWRIQRDSLVAAGGRALSQPGFRDDDWVVATVPGTALVSYWNAGALPNPNFGDNQLQISDSFFYADFWYRNEFVAPASYAGKHVFLNFDGVNWKADVYLNGEKLGRIDGLIRARFDVGQRLRIGKPNALAVRVLKNATPGSVREKTFDQPDKNGGALGADNPTFHATINWDWIPTIRGRDTGLWNDVFLTATGPVAIENPYVSATLPLPDTSRASVSVEVTLRNLESRPVSGVLRARFGDTPAGQSVIVDPGAVKTVKLALRLDNPKLWWPAGYGAPHLYNVELKFETADQAVSDATTFQAGVRQFTHSEQGGALRIFVNGRRLIPRGGNWGFPESMLLHRAREYDAAVRYHADMHFNMIRNWVGQTNDDEFYEACDRHGIVVWQDFWLANPWDGPDPNDNAAFLRAARDMALRIRNHPSVGLYCGRNEGYPPKPIEDGLRQILAELHPGVEYIGSSADGPTSGYGPYGFNLPKYYFDFRATPKLHSEIGMPNIVTLDSLRLMMPESGMWPQGRMWGLHDFALNGAQRGSSFRSHIGVMYGGAKNVADWVALAQFVNYEGYRAMYEAQSKNRMGALIWMSHPAWPSLVWQTYDYYLEPTAGYFGAKKANEPLHIQWNPSTNNVEVVNYSAGDARGLTARARLFNRDGALKWEKSAQLDSPEDSVASPIPLETLDGLHFVRLELLRDGKVVSDNFYWRGPSYAPLSDLPKVTLESKTAVERQGARWRLVTELHNATQTPAIMIRLRAVRDRTGDRILPVLYSDNYIWLLPGETRTITTDLEDADTRGESPRIAVEGFNLR